MEKFKIEDVTTRCLRDSLLDNCVDMSALVSALNQTDRIIDFVADDDKMYESLTKEIILD